VNLRPWVGLLVLAAALAAGARTAAQQPAKSPASTEPPLTLSPAEIEIYKRAKTLIDWTPQQIESAPFLRKLHPAENQDELLAILERVGKTAVALFHDFPKIACEEEVYSETNLPSPLASWGALRRNSAIHKFRYIVIPKVVGDTLGFEEYRTDSMGNPVDMASLGDLKMITSNFTSTWLYFSPGDQHESRFRYFGTQTLQKRECYVVGFAQNPETAHNVSGFRLGDRSVALLVQGVAWIDKRSYEIHKIETWLLAPRTDIGLDDECTVVDYFSVQPAGLERSLWVPRDVWVTIRFRRAYFRNTHRYSKFQVFRVESTIKPME
jgi:hypothetical protein